MPKTETQVLSIPALSVVDIHVIKVFGRATNGLLSRSLLFHSFLSLFSHPNVRHFCFFQEEEDRKIIKKGLPFFFAFFVNCWGPSWRKRDRFIKCFLSILPTINSCFPLVKSMYGQKKVRKLVEILSVTCLLCIFWTDQITLVWPFKSKRMLIC